MDKFGLKIGYYSTRYTNVFNHRGSVEFTHSTDNFVFSLIKV